MVLVDMMKVAIPQASKPTMATPCFHNRRISEMSSRLRAFIEEPPL
jgi:hypothetical protein